MNMPLQKDNEDRTPLHWACSKGQTDDVRNLLHQGADIDAIDESGWTPLMIACSAGHSSIVIILLSKASVSCVSARNLNGQTALHYAASKDRLEIAKLLIERGAEVNAKDNLNQTPLHRSASKGNKEMVQLLLNCNDIDVNSSDVVGNTPLHLACEEERVEEAKMLIEAKASTATINKEKKTPLEMCQNMSVRRMLSSISDRNMEIST